MMKRVLVTGGTGFIGFNLCTRLLEHDCHVICLDDLSVPNARNVRILERHPHFTFMQHDVTEPIFVEADQIYNLACPASPVFYQSDPVKTIKTNVMGMLNMLDLATKTNARILQASTSEVYGDPEIHPQPESYCGHVNPIGVRSCYDEGKRAAETLCFDYHRQHNTDIKVARIFNTYGPGMSVNDGRVISNFVVQALKGEDITIYGDGSQTRSFCYVDDLIDGIIRLMESRTGFTGPVNLGNPGEFTILELAQRIIADTESASKLHHMPLPSDDPRQRKPEIGLAKRELNWEPLIPLEEGLKKTIAHFRETLAAEASAASIST